MSSIGSPLLWSLFAAFVFTALFVDFVALNRQGAHKVSIREAAVWSLAWIAVSFVFVGWLWWHLGGGGPDPEAAVVANTTAFEFTTGYLIEKALAVDNVFVFLMLFTYFGVPAAFQKRVLMIGILGALVLRTDRRSKRPFCQRQIEMSGSPPSRDVRFGSSSSAFPSGREGSIPWRTDGLQPAAGLVIIASARSRAARIRSFCRSVSLLPRPSRSRSRSC
jgi:hypothetical protein